MRSDISPKDLQRFWSKVKKTNNCWEWTATRDNGYGRFNLNGKLIYAHRFSYEQINGSVPKGLQLDHLCRNPICVNPEHLEAVTNKENCIRGDHKTNSNNRKKTHCIRGHEFNLKNTYITKNNRRSCRICHRNRMRLYIG